MRVGTDAVGDVTEEIQDAYLAVGVVHPCIGRRIPPAHDKRHRQRTEELHHIQRLVLEHHPVRHPSRDDKREEGRKSHAHLENPPERPLLSRKGSVTEELIRLKDHVINILLEDVDTKIGKDVAVCHYYSSIGRPDVIPMADCHLISARLIIAGLSALQVSARADSRSCMRLRLFILTRYLTSRSFFLLTSE